MRRLPVDVWVESAPDAHDTTFADRLMSIVTPPTRLILDRGFWDFHGFAEII